METLFKTEFLNYCKETTPEPEYIFMNPKQMIFEECVKMNCFYCGKYGRNWRCPPNLPDIDYPKMFSEFDDGMFVVYTFDTSDKDQYEFIRNESSVILHKTLLKFEKWLYEHNSSTALSFGAGSCKLCKNGCGKDKCNNPYMSRSPLEATGVNIVKTAAQVGIDIRFPTNEKLMRIGLIVWQNPTS